MTRPEQQADQLSGLIEQAGGKVIRFPVLEIKPLALNATQKQQLNELTAFNWVIFISVNAVNFALLANNGKIHQTKSVFFAAVGKATANAIRQAGLRVDLIPEQGFNSEALLAMPALQQLQGQSCLIVRGLGGRELLAKGLRERGASVEYLEVYERDKPGADTSSVVKLINNHALDVITITSGGALHNLVEMLGDDGRAGLFSLPLVVNSDRIKPKAKKLGFNHIAVSEEASDAAIVRALINGEKCGRSE